MKGAIPAWPRKVPMQPAPQPLRRRPLLALAEDVAESFPRPRELAFWHWEPTKKQPPAPRRKR